MQKRITEKHQKILDFVNAQVAEKGYPPSVREICRAVGFKSTSTVHGYLEKLEEYGLIQKDPTKPRAIKVVHRPSPVKDHQGRPHYLRKQTVEVPIVGKVTAGQPILAVENIEDTFPLPAEFVNGNNVFMLKVKGDSMMEAGILDGDYIFVNQQSTAQNGDIIVALVGDEATVKTFHKEKDHVRLQPENRFYEPIIVRDVDSLSILGKVIGVFRKF